MRLNADASAFLFQVKVGEMAKKIQRNVFLCNKRSHSKIQAILAIKEDRLKTRHKTVISLLWYLTLDCFLNLRPFLHTDFMSLPFPRMDVRYSNAVDVV